jgi:hypothetical protein
MFNVGNVRTAVPDTAWSSVVFTDRVKPGAVEPGATESGGVPRVNRKSPGPAGPHIPYCTRIVIAWLTSIGGVLESVS